MFRTPTVSLARAGLRAATQQSVIRRAATTHAISNPTLANIEKRWEGMPLQEQAELWMALRDRMKGPWAELTLQEKKAGAFFTRKFHTHFLLSSIAKWSDVPREGSKLFANSSRFPSPAFPPPIPIAL